MSRVSGSFAWCIRWETIERRGGLPLYGGLLPDAYATLRRARRELHRLVKVHPVRPNPFGGTESHPVRYVVFARRPDDVHGL